MTQEILRTHLKEESYRRPLLLSFSGHLAAGIFFLFAGRLFPAPSLLEVGTGAGGGQGSDFVSVGLTSSPGGGRGMVKPALTPKAAVPSTPPLRKTRKPLAKPAQPVFERKGKSKPAQAQGPPRVEASEPGEPGAIPQPAEAGAGGKGGRSTGSGGGFGGGGGVRIGSGTGEGVFDSWYARQVEQRIGQNWLRTSLGKLGRPVETVLSFEIRPDGQIVGVEIERGSGIRSVDLAARRAVAASNPLPPLPYEFRHRRVRFVAHFQYPPR